jgi:hypothetical protein
MTSLAVKAKKNYAWQFQLKLCQVYLFSSHLMSLLSCPESQGGNFLIASVITLITEYSSEVLIINVLSVEKKHAKFGWALAVKFN